MARKPKSDQFWIDGAQAMRLRLATRQPPLKIREVQEVLGYSSTSAAVYALVRMQELGLVVHVETGDEKGEWYLV